MIGHGILPQFPLGSVLLPTMMLPLHVFEPRYLRLAADLPVDQPEFGVVLIERGSEVGGGDVRTNIGTVARVLEREPFPDGRMAMVCVGSDRFRVLEWLPDDPYPRATVEPFPDTGESVSDTMMTTLFERFDACRDLLIRHGIDLGARPSFHDDPALSTFQVAAMSPVGEHDRRQVLAAPGAPERAELLIEQLTLAVATIQFRLDAE